MHPLDLTGWPHNWCRQTADGEADRLATELRQREASFAEQLAAARAEAGQRMQAAAAEAADAERRAAAAEEDVHEWQVGGGRPQGNMQHHAYWQSQAACCSTWSRLCGFRSRGCVAVLS